MAGNARCFVGGFVREFAALSRRQGGCRTAVRDVGALVVPRWLHRLVRRAKFGEPTGVASMHALRPDFAAAANLSAEWRRQGFTPGFKLNAWHPARSRAWWLFDRTGIDLDNLDWFKRDGEVMRDPFLDRRLAEFALQVP